MKIKFLPFLKDADGQKWLNEVMENFLNENADDTAEINKLRNQKPYILRFYDAMYTISQPTLRKEILKQKETVSTPEVVEYYEKLHTLKEKRQEKWIKYFMSKVAEIYEEKLKSLSDDEKDKAQTTIVAALPEFFWCDINDNKKHTDSSDIINYQKPIYQNNVWSIFDDENDITKLTRDYPNLIFFAGTAKWKQPENENRDKQITYNTLFIYHSGNLPVVWGKHYFSSVDGFSAFDVNRYTGRHEFINIKNMDGGSTSLNCPVVNFNGIDFVYDICLDFIMNNNGTSGGPLSKDLCSNITLNNSINVLIAGGMPFSNNQNATNSITNMNSDIILRCDAAADDRGCNAEIYSKSNGTNLLNGKNGNDIVGNLEINF